MRRAKGLWSDRDYMLEHLLPIITALGCFPSQTTLETMGHKDLVGAIKRHHGGLRTVRASLGYAPIRKPKGHYRSFDNVSKEIQVLASTLERFPSQNELLAHGFGSLVQCVWRYHGGLEAVRWRMQLPPSHDRKARGHWKDFDEIMHVLRPIIASEGIIPRERCLRNLTSSSFIAALHRHHGGLQAVRKRVGCLPVTDELLRHYAPEIIQHYMATAQTRDRFDVFVQNLLASTRTENNLRLLLSMPPLAA